jgi:hypothetical protein
MILNTLDWYPQFHSQIRKKTLEGLATIGTRVVGDGYGDVAHGFSWRQWFRSFVSSLQVCADGGLFSAGAFVGTIALRVVWRWNGFGVQSLWFRHG